MYIPRVTGIPLWFQDATTPKPKKPITEEALEQHINQKEQYRKTKLFNTQLLFMDYYCIMNDLPLFGDTRFESADATHKAADEIVDRIELAIAMGKGARVSKKQHDLLSKDK